MRLKILLTFDHELPLGKLKTSYESALFEPTQRVLDLADRLGVKVNFFTDILCAKQFQNWDNDDFYKPYKNQLQNALIKGHDVQLHIHPHWLTTTYKDPDYHPSRDFGLSDFKNNSEFGGISGIIRSGIEELNTICREVNPEYQCIAYRAGGYNIAPCTTEIFKALQAEGILYDSSIAPGYFFKSTISEVDFTKLPKKPNWFIDAENFQNSSANSGVLEIPIATTPKSPFEIPTLFKMKKYAFRAPLSHGGMIHSEEKIDIISRLKMLFAARMLSFDNYTLSLKYLLHIVDYQVRKYKSEDLLMFSVVSHPKSMSDYSFELMEGFVREIQKNYPDAEFCTFSGLEYTQNTPKL